MKSIISMLSIVVFVVSCGDSSFKGTSGDSPSRAGKAAAPAAPNNSAASGSSETFTNVQEQGVDEPDAMKIGKNHIYVLRGNKLAVADRETLALVGQTEIASNNMSLYAEDDYLVTITTVEKSDNKGSSSCYRGYCRFTEPVTQVKLFKSEKGQMPSALKDWQFSGEVLDSRLSSGRLILVFKDQINVDDDGYNMLHGRTISSYRLFTSDIGKTANSKDPFANEPIAMPLVLDDDGAANGVACANFIQDPSDNTELVISKVVSINTLTPEEAPKSLAVQGGADAIYMTTQSLYLMRQPRWSYWGAEGSNENLLITKISFSAETGDIQFKATGMVDGRFKDQWAFNEYEEQGILAIATTKLPDNNLWLLKENEESHNLDVVASVQGFGYQEDIRSVRYIDNMAYIVTFKKTDPVFAFDLTDPMDPKLLSELKIPGFSTYMHPLGNGLMLGVGFDALDMGSFAWFQGLQVSLFDISDPRELKRLDNQVMGDRGSYSEVTWDHHAFYFDAANKIVGIPLVELHRPEGSSASTYGNELGFSGAILFNISDKLTPIARVSHSELVPEECKRAGGQWWQNETKSFDINRLFKVDERLLTLSRFGIKAHDPAQPTTTTASLAFPSNGPVSCSTLY